LKFNNNDGIASESDFLSAKEIKLNCLLLRGCCCFISSFLLLTIIIVTFYILLLLYFTGRPVVYPTNRTIMGFTGQPLSLSVEMCANPMPDKSFWIFGNTALKPGSRLRNKYVAQQLTVSHTQNSHSLPPDKSDKNFPTSCMLTRQSQLDNAWKNEGKTGSGKERRRKYLLLRRRRGGRRLTSYAWRHSLERERERDD